MPNEQIKPKPTALEKVDAIVSKLSINEQIELWKDEGDKIHQRIDQRKKEKQQEIDSLDTLQKEIK